ncbi:MAG: potassium transporter TrkG [Bacteroidales bacterium]
MKISQRKKEKRKTIIKRISRIPFIISLFSILTLLYEFGFEHKPYEIDVFREIYVSAIIIGALSIIIRYFYKANRPRLKSLPFDIILLLFLVLVASGKFWQDAFKNMLILKYAIWIYIAIFLVFIREFSAIKVEFNRAVFNPAQLFILSFLTIIVAGTFLLMLPKAAVTRISLIDALFTSTSAVCVTGLTVVDTGNFFTGFGQVIIVLLIQIGGLGIMTFTSYFSYFFRGGSSFESQLILRDLTNAEKLSEVFAILKRIILLTILIEGIGAFFVFHTLDKALIPSIADRLFFSVFHAISGFCNAGFSTLPNGFYESAYQFNYPLHITVAFLFIIGGLGFPIVFNMLKLLRNKIKSSIQLLFQRKRQIHSPWLLNVNTRIVLITSLILSLSGTIAFFILEYNNTLLNHSFYGKIVTAFFGSVTTRTAGFNTVDTADLSIPTVLIVIFLMWVGASPASTGGGIKTSTLAVAILNIINISKGNPRLEVYKREIPQLSVNRAFAIIVLSILVISLSVMLITVFDSAKGFLEICFECISAFSTVGLSRGITDELCSASKFVLVLTMFIGRVSMLTLLIAFFKKVSSGNYQYPTESILIN